MSRVPECRQECERHHDDARGRAEPHEQHEAVVVEHVAHGERPARDARQREEDRDHDEVVQRRCERRGREASPGIQQRGCERGDSVEEHLRHEQAEQLCGELLLLRAVGTVDAECVHVDDPRRDQDPDDRDTQEYEDRHREHGGCRVVVV